jgi:hypothetical protein
MRERGGWVCEVVLVYDALELLNMTRQACA